MENKEIKKVEEIKNTQESKTSTYKKLSELSGLDIGKFDKITGHILKTVSKKTKLASYSSLAYLHGIELRDRKFNIDKFQLYCLEKNREDLLDETNGFSVKVTVWYRPIKGKRKDNDEYFYGADLCFSNSYRVRIFFNDDQLKILRLRNIVLPYVEVEMEEEEFEEDFE